MIVYHADRRNKRFVGETIQLDTSYFRDYGEWGKSIYDMFPDGLSDHGNTYLDPNVSGLKIENCSIQDLFELIAAHDSHIIELFFEMIRQIKYPNCPSRLQSYFGVPDLDLFKNWEEIDIKHNKIYKFEVDDNRAFQFDASYLYGGIKPYCNENELRSEFTPAILLHYAEKYWSGEISANPKIEIVMSPPIKVIEEINLCD